MQLCANVHVKRTLFTHSECACDSRTNTLYTVDYTLYRCKHGLYAVTDRFHPVRCLVKLFCGVVYRNS